MLQVKTSVELSGKREVCSFRRNSTRMALAWSAELEQLLAQAISELYPAASWERREAGWTVGKCNVCQAVNEQFHGNIVTLLLTAIGAEFLSTSSKSTESSSSSSFPAPAPALTPSPSPSSAGVTIHLLVVPMLA